jgi:DNA ligase-1
VSTPFSRLTELVNSLENTRKHKEKTNLIGKFLKELEPEEVSPSVLLVIGTIFPESDSRVLDVGWRIVKDALEMNKQTTLFSQPLTILRLYNTLGEIAESGGTGSRKIKRSLIQSLLQEVDSKEEEILLRIIFGEMRTGVNEGIMIEGIAEAAGVRPDSVRRALMMIGDLGKVADIAMKSGEIGLEKVSLNIFTPLKPMLATMAYAIDEVIEAHDGLSAFEFKLDGARIQIHKHKNEVRIFSRHLSNVTESLPDIVALINEKVGAEEAVLEGEVIAIGEAGKPLPFQDLMRRFRRVHNVIDMVEKIPLKLQLFDILYINGNLLIDNSYSKRRAILESISSSDLLVPQIITGDTKIIEGFLEQAEKAGHEGLIAKRLDSVYSPGKRGKHWFKLKPVETLDLVIVAADWGYGRRTGWLSNYHLAARDGTEFRVIGKTFKGLTDEEFIWITKKLQSLKIREKPGTVYVEPSIVVEIAFNEIQKSPHYDSGFALRFARITRIREDKTIGEVDSLKRVQDLYDSQFRFKARVVL